MEIDQAIYAHLAADAGLTALCGTRVYPDQAAEGATKPFVVYEEAEQERLRSLAPHAHHLTPGEVGLGRYTMHLEIVAATKAMTKTVRAAIVSSLSGFQGTLGGGSQIRVQGVFNEAEESSADAPQHAEGLGEYRRSLDLSIWFEGR